VICGLAHKKHKRDKEDITTRKRPENQKKQDAVMYSKFIHNDGCIGA